MIVFCPICEDPMEVSRLAAGDVKGYCECKHCHTHILYEEANRKVSHRERAKDALWERVSARVQFDGESCGNCLYLEGGSCTLFCEPAKDQNLEYGRGRSCIIIFGKGGM
jgi:hypothetical protein